MILKLCMLMDTSVLQNRYELEIFLDFHEFSSLNSLRASLECFELQISTRHT